MKKTIFFFLFSLLFSPGCNTQDDNSITMVSYGTSFGMCIGYCNYEMEVKSDSIKYDCYGWNNSVAPKELTQPTTKISWDSIQSYLNASTFLKLPETIGCPDCADGGAEWIEITRTDGITHKVTFEYYNEPKEIKELVKILRHKLNNNKCN